MSHQMVTANRLSDGVVVYLTADGSWSTSVNEGQFVTEDEADALLKSADKSIDDCTVVDAYLIAVEAAGTDVRPIRFREQVRAKGPTVALTGSDR